MRRSMVLCLVAIVLLVASSASAQWYAGLRLAGSSAVPEIECYRNGSSYDHGLFDYTEMIFGYDMEKFDVEVSFGYDRATESYEPPDGGGERQYPYEASVSRYTFGMTGFYNVVAPNSFSFDAGLRFQLDSWDYEYDENDLGRTDYTKTEKISGWAAGPVFRGRLWFADDCLALGPEVYVKYSSQTLTEELDYGRGSREEHETDMTAFNVEYAVRLDFLF